ncbi:MAG: hypothetical protein F4151_12270 [Gammaproteobacteria bacterium]|nr:hypothetical protein [Chloroflexota bacterium]MYE83774.1 hypothetical protein [Gammaproteobacteria bacterium]MYH50270.1 hypothetical protein [Gammaproteobacteria bacterium]MYI68735.1 hypothetical protein [Boseongicola sp. SB0673_bin_14]
MRHEGTPGRAGGGAAAVAAPPGAAAASRGHRRRLPRRRRRGMVNVLLTVAIAAIVIGAMVGIFITSGAGLRTSNLQTTITALAAEIERAFANRREYAAGDYHDFLAPRMPSNAQRGAVGSEIIVTPWGGEIEAGGGATVGTAAASPNRFWIDVQDLPRAACITVAEALLEQTNIVSVSVDGTAVTTNALIEDNCDDANDNDVEIVYRG